MNAYHNRQTVVRNVAKTGGIDISEDQPYDPPPTPTMRCKQYTLYGPRDIKQFSSLPVIHPLFLYNNQEVSSPP